MQPCRPKTFAEVMFMLGCLALGAAACGSDDPAEDPGGVLDGGGGGAVTGAPALDGSAGGSAGGSDAALGNDAATPAQDAGGGTGGADAGQAGSTMDASSNLQDAGSNDAGRNDAATTPEAGADASATLEKFSFFVTSLSAMRQLSGSQNGFGGNLSFGETGSGAGLRGADKICTAVAELSMPGAGAKGWHAFLSTSTVNAKDRIGNGPWYDRAGRTVALTKQALLTGDRPQGADSIIVNDLPNERGEPNQDGSALGSNNDNHDTVTATNTQGVYDGSPTCGDWTTTATSGSGMRRGPGLGHSWPAFSGQSWLAAHQAPGCAASVNLSAASGGGSGDGIGNAGGYGGIYCFADAP